MRHESLISMHENEISMQKKEDFGPKMFMNENLLLRRRFPSKYPCPVAIANGISGGRVPRFHQFILLLKIPDTHNCGCT